VSEAVDELQDMLEGRSATVMCIKIQLVSEYAEYFASAGLKIMVVGRVIYYN
jgi:hypothetical protein